MNRERLREAGLTVFFLLFCAGMVIDLPKVFSGNAKKSEAQVLAANTKKTKPTPKPTHTPTPTPTIAWPTWTPTPTPSMTEATPQSTSDTSSDTNAPSTAITPSANPTPTPISQPSAQNGRTPADSQQTNNRGGLLNIVADTIDPSRQLPL